MHGGGSISQDSGNGRRECGLGVGNGPQAIHEALKDSLFGIVVAIADADASGGAPDLGRQNRNRNRVVANVVCFSWLAVVLSSRLNSISQQLML